MENVASDYKKIEITLASTPVAQTQHVNSLTNAYKLPSCENKRIGVERTEELDFSQSICLCLHSTSLASILLTCEKLNISSFVFTWKMPSQSPSGYPFL